MPARSSRPYRPIYDEDGDRTLLDVLAGSRIADPEELVIRQEKFGDIEEGIRHNLSDLEWKVLVAYLEGKTYRRSRMASAVIRSQWTTPFSG